MHSASANEAKPQWSGLRAMIKKDIFGFLLHPHIDSDDDRVRPRSVFFFFFKKGKSCREGRVKPFLEAENHMTGRYISVFDDSP